MKKLELRQIVKEIVEELCAKGKAYRKKRMAAGEKSSAYLSGRAVKVCKGQMQGEGEEIDEMTNDEFEKAKEADRLEKHPEKDKIKKIQKMMGKEKIAKEAKTKPAKGKRFAKKVKNPKTGRTRTVSYGQAGKAKKGGDRIRPGTAKGHAYCARSAKIKKCKNPPCANTLSRKKWKCQGSRSVPE